MFSSICDFLWVLQAFLRGKVLRQKAYRPQQGMFCLPVPVTAIRILRLVRWWGLRPMTAAEMWHLFEKATSEGQTFSSETVIKDEKSNEHVCELRWRDGRWEVSVRQREDWLDRGWISRRHFLLA